MPGKTPRNRHRKTHRQRAGAPSNAAAAPAVAPPPAPPPAPAPPRLSAQEIAEYSARAINGRPLAPVIINPASKFVVATYWWGRGVINGNLQRPCPDVFTEQIKEEILEEYEDDDPDWKAFTDQFRTRKAEVIAAAETLNPDQRKAWILMKAQYNVGRERIIDRTKELTEEQKRLPIGDPGRRSRFDVLVANRKSLLPYTGNDPNREGTGGLSRQPGRLEDMITRWTQTVRAANCNYLVQEYPEFAVGGRKYYQSAINAKPLFIKKALESCEGRTVLYIDGDMLIHQYPKIFDMPGVDFFAQGWVTDPRTNKHFAERPCFDPYIFETSGGTLAFGNTKTAMKLLDDWAAESHKPENEGKADDRLLSMLFTRTNMLLPVNVVQLPIEYLWLTDKYVNFNFSYPGSNGPAAALQNAIIEHPECLTAEEAAKDQGAAEDRSPIGYTKEVTDRAQCSRQGGIFYEFVYFGSRSMVDSMGPYLDYMTHAKSVNGLPLFEVVPWDKTYGEFQSIASRNMVAVQTMKKNLLLDDFVVVPHATPIPEIIYYLHNGKDVHIGEKIEGLDPEIQAAATNVGVRFVTRQLARYLPEVRLDVTRPMFFSSKSRVVGCLLRMCGELSDINTHLEGSYVFVSRIRWKMTQMGRNAPVPDANGVIQLPEMPESAEDLQIRMSKLMQAEFEKKEKARGSGTIPKKVHQIWFGGAIPPWRQYLFDLNKTVAERNGYTYKLWGNADRTAEYFKSTIAYQNGSIERSGPGQSRWAQVADLARMEILYNDGGVYLDSIIESGDGLYAEINRLSKERKAFIGCNEDPCDLDCVGAGGKKYLSNSFIATAGNHLSTVMERLLNDTTLGEIDLDNPNLNQTTGPYYLRTGILDPVADKVALLKTEEIYPFPMTGSVLRPAEPNPFLLREPSDNSIETLPGMWLQKDALQILQAQNRPVMPLAIYHVGLGGTWDTR